MGYDFLAIKAMLNRGSLTALGRKIGIGKESDIYLACNEEGTQMALKIHRLGRTSFTNVRNLRDYVGNRKGALGCIIAPAAIKTLSCKSCTRTVFLSLLLSIIVVTVS